MKCMFPLMALLLGSCSAPSPSAGVTKLRANVLACRNESSLATLHAAGAEFQRAADAELASGRCRVFEQGHAISGAGKGRFVDAASGITFHAYRPG